MKRLLFLVAFAGMGVMGDAGAQVVITNATVLAGGITAGDSAGYPATLSGPGSFKLGGNLAPPAGVSAVAITGNNVTLDLNGFTIDGGGNCPINTGTGTIGVICGGGSTGQVLVTIGGVNAVLKNGNVRGSGGNGVAVLIGNTAPAYTTLQDVNLSENRGDGLISSNNSVALQRVKSIQNGGSGATLKSEDALVSVEFSRNSNFGAFIDGSASIDNVTANYNSIGVYQRSGVLNAGQLNYNAVDGYIGYGVVTASLASNNQQYGFNTTGQGTGLVLDSSALNNKSIGFSFGPKSCYARLNAVGNNATAGVQIAGGIELAGLVQTCP